MISEKDTDAPLPISQGYQPRQPQNNEQRGYQPQPSGSVESPKDLAKRPPTGGSSIQAPATAQMPASGE